VKDSETLYWTFILRDEQMNKLGLESFYCVGCRRWPAGGASLQAGRMGSCVEKDRRLKDMGMTCMTKAGR
jgi:hypothetical protein